MKDKQNFRLACILFYSSPSYLSQSLSTTIFKDPVLSGFVASPTSKVGACLKGIKKYVIETTSFAIRSYQVSCQVVVRHLKGRTQVCVC